MNVKILIVGIVVACIVVAGVGAYFMLKPCPEGEGEIIEPATLTTGPHVLPTGAVTSIRGLFPSDVVITPDGTRAYVPCYSSNNVLVIDASNNQVVDAIDLSGAGPFGMNVIDAAITPDGEKIYLADHITGKIGVINTTTNQVTAFVDVEEGWIRGRGKRVEVTPDGKFAYITLESNRVPVIDVVRDAVVETIVFEEGEYIYLVGFSSDSSRAFLVSQVGGGRVYVVDTSTYAIIDRIDLGITQLLHTQASMAVAPDDREIYLVSGFNEGGGDRPDIGTNKVFVIDLESRSIVDEIEVIGGPQRISLSPDGRLGYVSTFSAAKVFVLDLINRTVVGDFDWNGIYEGGADYKRHDLRDIAIPPDGRSAYLVGWDADAIILLDLLEQRVTGAIELNPMLGAQPVDIVITLDGSKMYVSCWGRFPRGARDGIVVIDTDSNSVLDKIFLEAEPRRMDITPDGRFLYVPASPMVLVVDTATDQVVANISTEQPYIVHDVAIVPHQNKLYVSYAEQHVRGGIYVIDLSSNTVEKEIDVGWRPTSIVVTPDGSRLYVSRILNPHDEGALVVIDTATNQVIDAITPPISGAEMGDLTSPVEVTPDGAHVYWTTGWKWVNVVEVVTNKVLKTIDLETVLPGLPIAPSSIAFLSDGSRAYIACWDASYVVVLDTETWESVAVIRPGFRPLGIAITPDDRFAYVTNQHSEDVSVIDTATNTVVITIPLTITSSTPTPAEEIPIVYVVVGVIVIAVVIGLVFALKRR